MASIRWDVTRLEAEGKPTIDVTATPCRHGPPLSRPIVGDVIGFALRWDGQRNGVVWVSGDSVLYNGVREVADRLNVDVAILHLGEVQFPITGPVRYSMTAHDAVQLCRTLRPRVAIPVHYEGWSHFHEGREAIEREISQRPANCAMSSDCYHTANRSKSANSPSRRTADTGERTHAPGERPARSLDFNIDDLVEFLHPVDTLRGSEPAELTSESIERSPIGRPSLAAGNRMAVAHRQSAGPQACRRAEQLLARHVCVSIEVRCGHAAHR